jgi:hypothetical protein
MKPLALALAAALVCLAQPALCQTNFFPRLVCSNATYTDATIESVTPATVTVWWSGGGERISITNLPPELQRRYHYDPEAAQAYLDAQAAKKTAQRERDKKAAEALEEAKETFGPERTVRVINIVNDWHVQILVDGKVAEAYIRKLPPAVLSALEEYAQAKANADAFENVSTNATATRQTTVKRAGRTTTETIDTHKPTDAATTAMKTRRQLADLERHLASRTTVLARPSAFILSGGVRQWEFVEMAGDNK